MNIWILMVWDGDTGLWENMEILFNEEDISAQVDNLFKENEDYTSIRVEHWYKNSINKVNANFLGMDVYWRADWLKGE